MPENSPSGIDPSFAQKHPLRILIADDNEINRRVLTLMLQRFGYKAETTQNGQDCLDAALHRTFDLLLIDVNMPDMSGIDCSRQIRQAGRDFPIVAVTATDPEVSRRECFAAGMTGYLTKPVRISDLEATLVEASRVRAANTGAANEPLS